MIYSDFKKLVLSKTINREVIPPNAQIDLKVLTALKKVAKDTVPLQLIVQSPTNHSILRRIDEFTYIRTPNAPIADIDNIDIDEYLLDAVALYVAAGIDPARAPIYMGMYHEEIDQNNERLITTSLANASNESYFNDTTSMFP